MRALSSRPFCPCDGRQAGLWDLPARWRDTTFWNVIASGAPFWKPKAAPSTEGYPTVREARRTPPRLPSVKELADEHRQLYG